MAIAFSFLFLFLTIPLSVLTQENYPDIKSCLLFSKGQCPCGSTEEMVDIVFAQCFDVNTALNPAYESCEPCDMEFYMSYNPCNNFTECLTCDGDGLSAYCTSCPPGRTGNFCEQLYDYEPMQNSDPLTDFSSAENQYFQESEGTENQVNNYYGYEIQPRILSKRSLFNGNSNPEEDEYYINNIIRPASVFKEEARYRSRQGRSPQESDLRDYPFEVVIPAGQSLSDNRHMRSASECFFPDHMDTAEIRCTIWPTYTKCNVTCIWGHTLPSGRSVTIKCRNKENVWKPSGFKECDPYVDCSVKLKSPGSVNCVYNRLVDPIDCDIMCNEYDDIPEVPKKTYSCTIQGSFMPPLPFCVEKANTTGTVPPPAWR